MTNKKNLKLLRGLNGQTQTSLKLTDASFGIAHLRTELTLGDQTASQGGVSCKVSHTGAHLSLVLPCVRVTD